jgi:Xaa-Pro aminopeptidase
MNHYRLLRKALARRLSDGLILLSGGSLVARNQDVDYVFRQKSDFLYLADVEEPGCFLLLDPKGGREALFIPRIDNHHRIWLGHVPDPSEAKALFGVERAFYADELPKTIKEWRKAYRRAYADDEAHKKFKKELGPRNESAQLRDALDELRAVKTVDEIELLKRASAASGQAHLAAMRHARPGQYEYEVQAIFEAQCQAAGLRHLGYPSIVASGPNAAVLHYQRNNRLMKEGDLLLIDGAAECAGYGADITRTFPVSGRFSQKQKDIYSIVLETQKDAISRSRPGIVSADLHVRSMEKIAEGLKSLGILKGEISGLVEGGAVRLFYPHGLTHMLGLDVHDVTGGKKRQMKNPTKVPVRFVAKLEPGFVITMEPGIYFIPAVLNDKASREKYRGSVNFAKAEKFLDFGGVRIEDDIVIQKDAAPLNLTRVPKEIADVEAACDRSPSP